MRALLMSLATVAFVVACGATYDDTGRLFPPDVACDDLATCFEAKASKINLCLNALPDNVADYDGAIWTCVEKGDCLVTEAAEGEESTSRVEFAAFVAECFRGRVGTGHPLDAVWEESFWTDLQTCLAGDDADQASLVDLCYQ